MSKALMIAMGAIGVVMAAGAQTSPTGGKFGVINIQSAIVGTKDGQKAAQQLETEMAPRRKDVESKQAEITGLKDQLQKGANTLSDSAKEELYRNIDEKTKRLNRTMEDDQAELQSEQDRLLRDLSQKIMVVINKYAQDNGYSLIIDVSSPQTPVLFASNAIDVTKDIIDLYDKNAGAMSSPAPGTAAPGRAVAPSSTTRPSATRPAPGTTGH
jgi:outer membrane protein